MALLIPLAMAAPSPALAIPVRYDTGGLNLSGQYAGSVSDSSFGKGKAVANFVADGAELGGWFALTFGTVSYDDPALLRTTRAGISGDFEESVGSSTCLFSVLNVKYDRAKHTLRGTYGSVSSACYDQVGTFVLKQQCFYITFSDVRQNGGPMHC